MKVLGPRRHFIEAGRCISYHSGRPATAISLAAGSRSIGVRSAIGVRSRQLEIARRPLALHLDITPSLPLQLSSTSSSSLPTFHYPSLRSFPCFLCLFFSFL